MKHRRGAESIDRFLETAGTEKGIDFRIFALQRSANWRVMQDHDPALSLQLNHGLLEANGVTDRFLHELLNQRLTPSVQHPPAETAAEPADPRESNSGDFDGFTVEH